MNAAWKPSVGAVCDPDGVHFQVWAPGASEVELIVEDGSHAPLLMKKHEDGMHILPVRNAGPGLLYRYRIDGKGPFPDPAARFQPKGVHGPSEVIDPDGFQWTDSNWTGPDESGHCIYELHVGTFTHAGTIAAAVEKLALLKELGITVVELMPLADFAGNRGWGYDGVCPYAPARCYGRPDEVRRFVDRAHALGLAVIIDVVYNHLGPDGNYLSQFSPDYFSKSHTDWGAGPNFDGDNCHQVRKYFIENALHWVYDYHFDGVRLDATHAIRDESNRHFLAEISDRLHEAGDSLGRRVLVIAEDERNLATLVGAKATGGYGLDGVWADDLHHQIRRALTGQKDGYYADYSGTAEDIADTLRHGWYYCGQKTVRKQTPRGTNTEGIPLHRFVACLQNHDQIGNRAFGERLNHQIDPSAYRAATALLLVAAQTPLIFMGQEWASSSPFLYFTDHHAELGKLVTEGRRKEFSHFSAFADPKIRLSIPDPQSVETFHASSLNWEERHREPYAGTLRLYQDLLTLRRCDPSFQSDSACDARAVADGTILISRLAPDGSRLHALIALVPGIVTSIEEPGLEIVLTTEHEKYATNPRLPMIALDAESAVIHFPCPAAVLFRSTKSFN